MESSPKIEIKIKIPIHPIQIHFDPAKVTAMLSLLAQSPLPSRPPIPSAKWELGMDLDFLAAAKSQFETAWSVEELEGRIGRYPSFLAEVPVDIGSEGEGGVGETRESVKIHFVHARSTREDAIAMMMLHGWPGTFFDFHKVIEPLINPPEGQPAFHLVIPSLPGYFMSELPQREGWTLVHSAILLNRLMVDGLGYETYVAQGGDWGSYILRAIGNLYPQTVPAIHFNMFRCPEPPHANAKDLSLSELEKRLLQRREDFANTGRGYIEIQSTKPFTIGYAISSSPLALLAYIGEKFYAWSDPRWLDDDALMRDLVDTVALYYLTDSFASSVMIYQQSKAIRTDM